MNVKLPSSKSSPRRREAPFSAYKRASNATAISISDLVLSVEPDDFNLNDTTPMDSTTFYRVFLNDDHNYSRCQRVKNIKPSIRSQDMIFEYWRDRQVVGTNSPVQTTLIVSTVGIVARIATVHRRQAEVGIHQQKRATTKSTNIRAAMLCVWVRLQRAKPVRKTKQ